MLRRGNDARLHSLGGTARSIRRDGDHSAGLQRPHDAEQPDFAAALRGASHRVEAPLLREIREIAAITVTTDEQHHPLALVQCE